MSITLKPGARLISSVCTTELITVKAPKDPIELTIGGVPPAASAAERAGGEVVVGHRGGALMGKRYVDAADTIELLCTKAGDGVPAIGGVVLDVRGAKALPASD
jgi:hypothetical protein